MFGMIYTKKTRPMLNFQQFRNRNINQTSDENELRRMYYVYTNNTMYEQSTFRSSASQLPSSGGRRAIQEVSVAPGGTATVDVEVGAVIAFTFTGGPGTTASVNIDGTVFLIENSSNELVFDSDDANGQLYTFSTIGESYNFVTDSEVVFTITWTGIGSLLFNITGITDNTVNRFVEDDYIEDYLI